LKSKATVDAEIKFTISYLAGTNLRLAVFLLSSTRRNGQSVPGLSAQMPSLGVYFGERKVDEKGSRCFVRRSRNRHDYSRHTDTG